VINIGKEYFVEFEIFTVVTMKNAPSGMWRCVGLVRTDFSEERVASIFRAEKIPLPKKQFQPFANRLNHSSKEY
jgi:hypothetical protein